MFVKVETDSLLDCVAGGFRYFFTELWRLEMAMTYQYQVMKPYLLPMQKYSPNYT